MASIFLLVASLLLFWLASDLSTTLAITYITTATILLGVGFFLWSVVEAWSFATAAFSRK